LAGGWASDIFGRIFIFQIGSVLWLIASIITFFSSQIGYMIAAGCIGLLNNLTFVIIMEKFPKNKDIYTIYVLMGWAVSQITLGIVFYII
jgi:MFS family permease